MRIPSARGGLRSGNRDLAPLRAGARVFQDETDSYRGPGASLLLRPPPGPAPLRPASARRVGDNRARRGRIVNSTTRYRNPLTLLLSRPTSSAWATTAMSCSGSTPSGGSAVACLLEAQVGLDDLQYEDTPGRTATAIATPFTLAASGPLAQSVRLARVLHPGVEPGLPVTRPVRELHRRPAWAWAATSCDQDQLTLTVTAPAGIRWLFTPELTLLRQGEGRINDRIPSPRCAAPVPTLFIGTVEKTWRAALGISGEAGTAGAAGQRGIPPRRERGQRGRAHSGSFRGAAAGDAGPEPPGGVR